MTAAAGHISFDAIVDEMKECSSRVCAMSLELRIDIEFRLHILGFGDCPQHIQERASAGVRRLTIIVPGVVLVCSEGRADMPLSLTRVVTLGESMLR